MIRAKYLKRIFSVNIIYSKSSYNNTNEKSIVIAAFVNCLFCFEKYLYH
ncbi:protein of unknown function [Ruminococcaceae bacterium BL-4]|nr:protein of unknown function [Ruminococcaceae bacterium BL-4]